MEIHQKKAGVIRSWNEPRGFGIVRVGPASSLEKYFLHVSQIRSGTASPLPGMAVSFIVGTGPVKPGQLQQALDADIDVHSIEASTVQIGADNGGAA
jgi:cold shock CspA family protein